MAAAEEQETTHMGERRQRETPSHPAHVAGPRPSSDTLAVESSAKGLCMDRATTAAETCQARCHGLSDKPSKIQFLSGQCKCSVCAQEAQHVLAAGPGSHSSAEPNSFFLVKINVFVIDTLFFFFFYITKFQVTIYASQKHN